MSTAYIVQEPLKRDDRGVIVPRISYRTLTPYGDVRCLFAWDELKDADQLADTRGLLQRLKDALCTFSDDDYIVPLGNPALIALAVLVAAECNDGRVRVLDWIKERKCYRVVTVDLDSIPWEEP